MVRDFAIQMRFQWMERDMKGEECKDFDVKQIFVKIWQF